MYFLVDLSISCLVWAWFGVFFCQSPFKKYFPYDSKNTLIILNMPERHLDCYLVTLEVTKGKLGGEKDLVIKYTLLNFSYVMSTLFRFQAIKSNYFLCL